MSTAAPPTAASSKGPGGIPAATAEDASGVSDLMNIKFLSPTDISCDQLLNTLQGHVDEIRGLLQCGICIRPLYEPFTLACGHTFCYGVSWILSIVRCYCALTMLPQCLTSWFSEGRRSKTCPDCRGPVRAQPAPAYLVRSCLSDHLTPFSNIVPSDTRSCPAVHGSRGAFGERGDHRSTRCTSSRGVKEDRGG